jgi:hypothetical protein
LHGRSRERTQGTQQFVEIKACRALADEHTAQILGYLKSSRIEDGLLINFGSYKFQIKKYILSRERTQGTQREQTDSSDGQ